MKPLSAQASAWSRQLAFLVLGPFLLAVFLAAPPAMAAAGAVGASFKRESLALVALGCTIALTTMHLLAWTQSKRAMLLAAAAYTLAEGLRACLLGLWPQPAGASWSTVALMAAFALALSFVPRLLCPEGRCALLRTFFHANSAMMAGIVFLAAVLGPPATWFVQFGTLWCALLAGLMCAVALQNLNRRAGSRLGAALLALCYGFSAYVLAADAMPDIAPVTVANEIGAGILRLMAAGWAVLAVVAGPGKASASTSPRTASDTLEDVAACLPAPAHRQAEQRLTEALASLETALDTQRQMNSLMSHELRTPVSTISAAAQSLEMILAGSDEIVDSRLSRIRRSIHRITELMDQFLNQERLRESPLTPMREVMDLTELARQAIGAIQPDAAHRLVLCGEAPAYAMGDKPLTGIVLRNLVHNAIKYSPASQPVHIETGISKDTEGRMAWIAVTDHGPGIEPHERERIFEPHYRRAAHRETKGMGIGLYLVRQICQRQGGSLSVESKAGHGARFLIKLPAAAHQA